MKNEFQATGLASLANLARETLVQAQKEQPAATSQAKGQNVETTGTVVPLPIWCSRSCYCLDVLDLPDGKVGGCVQKIPGWKERWRRLSQMTGCPLR